MIMVIGEGIPHSYGIYNGELRHSHARIVELREQKPTMLDIILYIDKQTQQ